MLDSCIFKNSLARVTLFEDKLQLLVCVCFCLQTTISFSVYLSLCWGYRDTLFDKKWNSIHSIFDVPNFLIKLQGVKLFCADTSIKLFKR